LDCFQEEVLLKKNEDLRALAGKKKACHRITSYLRREAFLGYKHTEDAKQRMKDNYSEERKEQIGSINKGRSLSDIVKAQLRD